MVTILADENEKPTGLVPALAEDSDHNFTCDLHRVTGANEPIEPAGEQNQPIIVRASPRLTSL